MALCDLDRLSPDPRGYGNWRHHAPLCALAIRWSRRRMHSLGFQDRFRVGFSSDDDETRRYLRAVSANGSMCFKLEDDNSYSVDVRIADDAEATMGTVIEEMAHAVEFAEMCRVGAPVINPSLVPAEEKRAKECILALAEELGVCEHGVQYAERFLADQEAA